MPPKKKGAKKGSKGKQDEDEYQEAELVGQVQQIQSQQPQPIQQEPPKFQQANIMPQPIVQQQQLASQPLGLPQTSEQIQESDKMLNVQQTFQINTASSSSAIHHHSEISTITAVAELSLREKKELRKQRFKKLGDDTMINTLDALEKAKEEKLKRIERAQKFGIPSKEIEEEKKRERARKFGLGNASSIIAPTGEQDEKKQLRAIRFNTAVEQQVSSEEQERKKKRIERFGGGQAAEQSISSSRVVKRIKLD